MRVALSLSAFLCASSAAASGAIDAFKRVDRVLEPRAAAQHNAPTQSPERLQKRASPFLNNITESECATDWIHSSYADWPSEFVVDGTKIPDVDVCWMQCRKALQAKKHAVRCWRVIRRIGTHLVRCQRDSGALLLVCLTRKDVLYNAYHPHLGSSPPQIPLLPMRS